MRHQTPEVRKLAELRALTDRQLSALIGNRLKHGFALAQRLEDGESEHYDELVQVCSEVARLLPVVSRLDRPRLQCQLARLQGKLARGITMQAAS
jgi:hypothetical protein